MEWIVAQGDKPISRVKCRGFLIQGIDLDGVNPDVPGKFLTPLQGVDKKTLTQALTLNASIHREASQKHDGHGMPREPSRWSFRECLEGQCTGPERVITENPWLVSPDGDIGPSQVAFLVLTDEGVKEIVERSLTATKLGSLMGAAEALDSPINHASSRVA